MRQYLINSKKPRSRAHIWTGTDTCCRMHSTAGFKIESYAVADRSGVHPICHMCENAERDYPVSHVDVEDALRVMIAAWEAQTTRDGLSMIGLGLDVTFPAMPSRIKSYADARRILDELDKRKR